MKQGWGENQDDVVKQCFDSIPANGEPIATIAIGTGLIGSISGANFCQIVTGMDESEQQIILHGSCTMKDIQGFIREEKEYKASAKNSDKNEGREVFVELCKML